MNNNYNDQTESVLNSPVFMETLMGGLSSIRSNVLANNKFNSLIGYKLLASFRFFLDGIDKINNSKIDEINSFKNLSNDEINSFSREERRFLTKENKTFINKPLERNFREFAGFVERLKNIIDKQYKAEYVLKNDIDFVTLTVLLYYSFIDENGNENPIFKYNEGEVHTKELIDFVMKYYMRESRRYNASCNFLSCFDEKGNLEVDKAFALRSIFYTNFSSTSNCFKMHKNLDIDDVVNYFISAEDFELCEQINLARRKEEDIIKDKIKEEKKKQAMEALKNNEKREVVKIEKVITESDKQLAKVMTSSYSLKNDVCKTVSKDRLLEILTNSSKVPNSDIEKFMKEYDDKLFAQRLDSIYKLLPKNYLQKLKIIFSKSDQYESVISEIRKKLLNSDYKKTMDEDKKEYMMSLIDSNLLKETNAIRNYIIFPSNDFINEELDYINNSKMADSKEALIKSVYTHLLTLQNHNINDIKANQADAFHELLINNHNEFVLDNKLKGYRYGAKRTKIGVFILSVCQENKQRLSEKYQTDLASNAILVFGAGTVISEKEEDLLERFKKYALLEKNNLIYINDIFANPFTEETFKIACDFIDNGILTIPSIENYYLEKQEFVKKI